MELMFIGADHEVTGSCHYLKVGTKHILIDCGMEQGKNVYENEPLPVPPSMIDYCFITHAHIDHTGMLPKLYKDGFRGEILMTEATADLSDIMLRDSAHIQMAEAQWKTKKGRREDGKPVEPIYTMQDALNTLRLIKKYPYHEKITLTPEITFRFTDVGHLLGSASIELWLTEGENTRKIVFSGDIGNTNQPLIKDPQYTSDADYVVMESTYGDRMHEKGNGILDKEDYVGQLASVIEKTLSRGGNVIIPSFAVGRTQEVLYFIRKIKTDNLVPSFPNFPVYVDSPLATSATQVFLENETSCFDQEAMNLVTKGINPITFKDLRLTVSVEESKAINVDPEPKVIIAASGMCDAGRVKHHLKYNLWRPECTVLFVGYQSNGTPGRSIIDGAKQIKIFGEPVQVAASIEKMNGLSGHADKKGLLDWITHFEEKPKKVFVVHGDADAADAFTECLTKEHGLDAYAPYSGTRFDLMKGTFIEEKKGVLIAKKVAARSVSDSYTHLKMTGSQINDMIKQCEGRPNKELDSLTEELAAVFAKYNKAN